MRTYGVFDGVARHNNLVVAAVPDYEAWKKLSGSDKVDDYLDFLLEQENALYSSSEPVRIVRIPLDLEYYNAWLKKNSYWRDSPEARAAWALDVAENPEELNAVIKRNPVLPRAPENWEGVSVYFAVFMFSLDSINEVGKLMWELDPVSAEEVARAVERTVTVPGRTPFKKVSRLRADGVRVVVGDRLVLFPFLEEVESFFEDVVPNVRNNLVGIPGQYRITKDSLGGVEYPAYVSAFLPVALHGAADVLDYCEESLAGRARLVPEMLGVLYDRKKVFKDDLAIGFCVLIPEHEAEWCLERLFSLKEQHDAGDTGENRSRKPEKKGGNLKRIK
ncbi:MAG: hypothetical protein ACUVSK_09570 [Desulfotomaculales bacterium]